MDEDNAKAIRNTRWPSISYLNGPCKSMMFPLESIPESILSLPRLYPEVGRKIHVETSHCLLRRRIILPLILIVKTDGSCVEAGMRLFSSG